MVVVQASPRTTDTYPSLQLINITRNHSRRPIRTSTSTYLGVSNNSVDHPILVRVSTRDIMVHTMHLHRLLTQVRFITRLGQEGLRQSCTPQPRANFPRWVLHRSTPP